MAIEVNCSVAQCYFWKPANVCGAERIWVNHSGAARRSERMDASGELLAQAQSTTSDDTCCQTYKPRQGNRN